ncbi:hypothetical protein PIB30_025531 [Stylosanthes scabra]|uniref:Uncharacterized protein n=1 Tax=Stylosanthes scabra TaxID=79078 RepID=A0ABU6Z6Z9_9FABA|nr:hypothetical protein [Stylosanthes scabra]
MDAIDEIDDKLKKNPELLRTPDPLGTDDIIADMERRVAVWGTIPKGDNEWLHVFKLKGDKHLEALRYQFKSMAPTNYVDIQVVSILCHILNRTPGERYQNLIYCVPPEILQRMFESFEHKWRDGKKKKPHEINELLNIDEYLSFLEKDGLMGRRFPNDYDCAIFVMKWMEELDPTLLKDCHAGTREHNIPPWNSADLEKFKEKIVLNILLSPENLMRMDVVTEVNEIRLIRPGAALRSPFIQLDSADLKSD